LSRENIVGAVGLKNYLALWFHKGVFLKDPENVLSTGKGQKSKSMRQWRIYQPGDVDPAKITHYVQQAIEVEKQGLSIPVDRSMPEIPPILESAMEQHAELREAFNKLTPGRQKEYMQY